MSLKDKNVVVTGGSRGLGLGLVEALVDHGARVTVVTRQSDALEAVRPGWRCSPSPPTSGTGWPRSVFSPRSGRISSR